jgi:hypothetical protein
MREFSEADLRQLEERGISPDEAARQLALFDNPPGFMELERPCTVGDGVVRLRDDDIPELHSLHEEAAAAGRFRKFVPASGAATRMFKELIYFERGPGRGLSWEEIRAQADAGAREASALVAFMAELDHFPFRDELRRQAGSDDFRKLLHALLRSPGLDYGSLPKGLLKFHAYTDGSRTPFEEHLVEAALYVKDATGTGRMHLTVSPEHRDAFAALFFEVRARYEEKYGVRFDVDYSVQKRSTDTLAVDMANRPLRDEQGRLLFRPGGHGALIENLDDLYGDLVFVKNIDNVQPDHRKDAVLHWKKALGGYLVKLQREARERIRALEEERGSTAVLEEAVHFAGSRLAVELDGRLDPLSPRERCAFLIDRLDRPLRVCGVVPNRGEPGGGPFWVRRRDGTVSKQIVEGAEIDRSDAGQEEILADSTHFNPVDLVCGLRDAGGRPYDLSAYVDEDAVMISSKSSGGRELKALERPGLWNGGMAGWNTIFVETPIETFSPVKSILDLLRDEHQPPPP